MGWEQVCEWRGTKAQNGSEGQSWGSSVEEVGPRGGRMSGGKDERGDGEG